MMVDNYLLLPWKHCLVPSIAPHALVLRPGRFSCLFRLVRFVRFVRFGCVRVRARHHGLLRSSALLLIMAWLVLKASKDSHDGRQSPPTSFGSSEALSCTLNGNSIKRSVAEDTKPPNHTRSPVTCHFLRQSCHIPSMESTRRQGHHPHNHTAARFRTSDALGVCHLACVTLVGVHGDGLASRRCVPSPSSGLWGLIVQPWQ